MTNKPFSYAINVSQAAAITGIDPRTIKKAARGLRSRSGPKSSIEYDAHELLPAIFLGPDGKGTASEALRKLSLARTAQIELDMQIRRRERVPLCDVIAVNNEVDMAIAGIIKSSGLPIDAVNEILDQLRRIGEQLVDAPVADMKLSIGSGAEDDKGYQEACAARDKWHADIDAAVEELRRAYDARKNSLEATAEWEAAQEKVRATARLEPRSD